MGKARRYGATDDEIREAMAVAEVIAAGKVRTMIQLAEPSGK